MGRNIWRWFLQNLSGQAFGYGWGVLSPFVVSVVTLISGLIQIPVAYAIATAGAVFAAVSIGVFYFYQLAFQRSASFKLVPMSPSLGIKREQGEGSSNITGVKLGISLNNISLFPIQYEVESIDRNQRFLQQKFRNIPKHPIGLLG